MTFRYDSKALKVIDDETGIEMRVWGQTEINMLPFEFFDPRSSIPSRDGPGRFHLEAKNIFRTDKIAKEDGSVVVKTWTDGFKIDRRSLWADFSRYVDGDQAKFEIVCKLISSGLKAWLRHNVSMAKEPTVSIV